MILGDGDLVFVAGKGVVSDLINVGTLALPNRFGLGQWAGYSHVGIVCDGFVFESTSFGRPPCRITGQRVAGVQAQTFSTVALGKHVGVLRLQSPLYPHEILRLRKFLRGKLGTPYDMMGAARSGGGVLSYTLSRMLNHSDLQNIFCSELCCAAYTHVGRMHAKVSQAWNPNFLYRYLKWSGISVPIKVKGNVKCVCSSLSCCV